MSFLLPNLYIEVLTSHVIVFGDEVFKEVIKVDDAISMGPSFNGSGDLIRRKRDNQGHVHTEKKAHVRTKQEVSFLEAKERGFRRRNQICQHLILDLQSCELCENEFLLAEPPSSCILPLQPQVMNIGAGVSHLPVCHLCSQGGCYLPGSTADGSGVL